MNHDLSTVRRVPELNPTPTTAWKVCKIENLVLPDLTKIEIRISPAFQDLFVNSYNNDDDEIQDVDVCTPE